MKVNEKTLLFGIVRDITEKKKTEEALHRAVKEIESLVEERKPNGDETGQKSNKEAVKG